ncbi:MAG: hypothetical protein L6Q71_10325, partial [Planctomycetes bacterium]|nr:hypothetical protein [Planctomycetota bacterium]
MTRASTTKRTRAPARILEGNALRLERDLILLFAAVRDHPAKLLKSGAPSKTFFTRLREMFKDVSADAEIDGYILFLLGISRAAGLLHERDEHLHPNT